MLDAIVSKEVVQLITRARGLLLKDGELFPVCFIRDRSDVSGSTFVAKLLMETDDQYENLFLAGHWAREEGSDVLICMYDAAARRYDNKDFQYAMDNVESESPLSYPKAMRRECIVCSVMDFSTRVGYISTLFYSGDHPDLVFDDSITELTETSGAVMDNILGGYDVPIE